MALLVYRVRVDQLTFPYNRELVAIYTNDRKKRVQTWIENFNNKRDSTWVYKLESTYHPDVDVNPSMTTL